MPLKKDRSSRPLPPPGADDHELIRGLRGSAIRQPTRNLLPAPPTPIALPDDPDDDDRWEEPEDDFEPEIPAEVPDRSDRVVLTSAEERQFRAMLEERARRDKEALRLYEPFPTQLAFHASQAGIRLPVGGNRGGKTLMAAVEAARAFTGTDPYGKYPSRGRAILVGKDLKHCGEVMYRKVFKGGSPEDAPFKIIRDLESGDWRAYRPNDPDDRSRKADAKPVGPLVPPRLISSIAWEDKKQEIPKKIIVTDGKLIRWEVNFFTGEGEPPQGWDVDFIWLDEEIPHPKWFSEMVPRAVEKRGRIIWSATPQVGTAKFYELRKKAEETVGDPSPRVAEFFVNIFSNEYIAKEAAEQFAADLADDEEEYRVRVMGESAMIGKRVYGEAQLNGIHKAHTFPVPDDWCRYVAIDPGRTTAAAAIAAVPPPDDPQWQGVEAIIAQEVYVRKATAETFARSLKETLGDHWVREWIIDGHESRKHDTGSGKNIEEQYRQAFKDVGLEQNGFTGNFIWGDDNPKARILSVKSKLHIHSGRPRWLFMTDNLRWMTWEFERYSNRTITRSNLITDEPLKLHDHLMDCIGYLSQHRMVWQKPPKSTAKPRSWTNAYLRKKKARAAKDSPAGGGIALF